MTNQSHLSISHKELPDRNDENYQAVREIFDILCREKLTVRGAHIVLDQVKVAIGYTPLNLNK